MHLLRYDELRSAGHSARAVSSAGRAGRLLRVRPGIYVDARSWSDATPEARVIARARSLALISAAPPVFSHETAAAIHGLPLFRANPDRVHVIASDGRPGAASAVIRHRGTVSEGDVVEVGGLRVTTIERTVADMARTATFEQSVTVADAALRTLFVPRVGEYLREGAEEFRQTALEIMRHSAHGQSRARRTLAFADGRAQLPGESISRIRLHELGFRRIDLQSAVPGPHGSPYFVDFDLEDVPAFGEFDGAMKYVDGRLTDGRTTAEVFDREKQREDWIRGHTQRTYVRWGWPHISTAQALAVRLAAFGIRSPR